MEIKDIIGRMECNISFDPTWEFIENNHQDAYVLAFQYLKQIIKPLSANSIRILSKKAIKLTNIKYEKVTKMFGTYFSYYLTLDDLDNIENIIIPIYYSDNTDIIIVSKENLKVTISSDPITVSISYGQRSIGSIGSIGVK